MVLGGSITDTDGGGGTALHFDRLDERRDASERCLPGLLADSGRREALELWAKPQPHGAVAVLLVNSHQTNTYADIEIDPVELGLKGGGKLSVRDIWQRKDSAPLSAGAKLKLTVAPRDSQFVLLKPA